jgi:hypothetical protein
MRVVAEIPHEHYKIQIFNFSGKYILQIALDQYEQSFKIGETDVANLDNIKQMITPTLLSNCLKRFISMREDWNAALNTLNQ